MQFRIQALAGCPRIICRDRFGLRNFACARGRPAVTRVPTRRENGKAGVELNEPPKLRSRALDVGMSNRITKTTPRQAPGGRVRSLGQ